VRRVSSELMIVVQIFSATKLITTVGCLIAVDRGLLSLDSEETIEKYLPELTGIKILTGFNDDGSEISSPAKNKITLKMLLSHSAGFAYAFNSPLIARWGQEQKLGSMVAASATIDTIKQPILYEPGTDWHYSIGLDWAGVLLTRMSGQTLEQYFKENIFDVCGMKSTSFFPSEELKSRMMTVCERDGGKIRLQTGPTMGREMDAEKVGPFLSGGGGLFGTARDYLSFLRAILDSGDGGLLSSKSFETLFEHALKPDSAESLASLAAMAKEQNIHDPAILTDGTGGHIAHSVGLFINLVDSKYGRKAGSGCWDGAAKTYYFIDPATGIASVCFTNLLAPNPDVFNGVYNRFEETLYRGLAS